MVEAFRYGYGTHVFRVMAKHPLQRFMDTLRIAKETLVTI
jgi:hypothetical protein